MEPIDAEFLSEISIGHHVNTAHDQMNCGIFTYQMRKLWNRPSW